MLNSVNYEKQLALENLLKQLADPEISIDDEEQYNRLRYIYSGDFRHLYSGIFIALKDIDNQGSEEGLSNLAMLSDSLKELYEYCKVKCLIDATDEDREFLQKVRKLYDHVNLEIARMDNWRYSRDAALAECQRVSKKLDIQSKELINVSKKVKGAFKSVSSMKDDVATAEKVVKDTEAKVAKLQSEYVAILGVFAAIVMAFVAGAGYSGMTLNALGEANPYKLIMFYLIIAFFLFNIFKALCEFLLKITGKENNYEVLGISANWFNWIVFVLLVFDLLLYKIKPL